MSKKSGRVKHQDEAIAHDLGLTVSNFAVPLKRAASFTALVKQLVFSYSKDELVYYDVATTWTHVNSLRCKRRKFGITPAALKRLHERAYNRWFFHDGTTLVPIQIAKVHELLDYFYFIEDLDPRSYTRLASELTETQFLRKKPLVPCRPMTITWGAPLVIVPLREIKTA